MALLSQQAKRTAVALSPSANQRNQLALLLAADGSLNW